MFSAATAAGIEAILTAATTVLGLLGLVRIALELSVPVLRAFRSELRAFRRSLTMVGSELNKLRREIRGVISRM